MLKRLLQLSRTKLGILTISIIAVVATILIVFNVFRSNEPSESVLVFCEEYPDAVVCTDEEHTTLEIAYHTFDELQSRYPTEIDETFCRLYFGGNLSNYCQNNIDILFPTGFHAVSSQFYIEEVTEGIYDVYTQFTSGNPAYIIRLSFTEVDGILMISGFSFVDAPPIIDLALTYEDINTYMIAMIEASTNQTAAFCSTYFVDKASQDCNTDPSQFVFDNTIIYNYDIISVITNDYFYMVRNQDGTITYQYHVDFIEENDTIVISDISVKELE